MAKTRRNYTGGAVTTTTTSVIGSTGTTSFTVSSTTGWPYGTAPFFVVLEPGTSSEEKILVTRSGSSDLSLTVYGTPNVESNRGLDGTSASSHTSGSSIYPVFTAQDADEANELASTLTTKGDLLSHGSTTFARVGVGSNNHVLVADSSQSTGLKWDTVGTDSLASSAVTTAKIGDNQVTTAKIADNQITTAKIADNQITTAKIADDQITTSKIANSQITKEKLAADAIIPSEAVFTITGTLTTGARIPRFYVEGNRTITNVVASVGVAPTGSSVIFDVNKNGTTIFSTQANRPTISISGFYDGSSVPDVTSLSAGDYLTIDVDQIGSNVKGSDAVIRVVFG